MNVFERLAVSRLSRSDLSANEIAHSFARRPQSAYPRDVLPSLGSASSVVSTSLETSVPKPPRAWHRFEERRREKLEHHRQRWDNRARAMAAAGDVRRALYATRRASALGRNLRPTVDRCGGTRREMRCACPPHVQAANRVGASVELSCKQHLVCGGCMRKRSTKLVSKMAAGLTHHLALAKDAWRRGGCRPGGRPQIVLMTLTIAHSGDVEQDRSDLAAGWRAFYKRLHRREWNGPYCGAWEATSGRDGLGHVHLHIAIVWPFVDWSTVARLWRESCPRSKTIDLAARRKDKQRTTGWTAAKYIGKYIGKGVALLKMGEELAADIVAATYNQRTVLTSRRFWLPWERPVCECCGDLPHPWVPLPRATFAEIDAWRAERHLAWLAELEELRLDSLPPQQSLCVPMTIRTEHA